MTAEGKLKEWLMGHPLVYRAHSFSLLSNQKNKEVVDKYIATCDGARILDIGCGTARVLQALPEVNYVGVDHNLRYLQRAERQNPNRGEFKHGDVREVARLTEKFDRVLLFGLLHHLPDIEALSVVSRAAELLAKGGRLVVGYDPTFHKGQNPISRFLARADRGKFVRTPEQYLELIKSSFSSVEWEIRTDILRIPYSHFFATARLSH